MVPMLCGCLGQPSCDDSVGVQRALDAGGYPDACVRVETVNGSGPRLVTVEWPDPNHDPDTNLAHAKELKNIVFGLWPKGVSGLTVRLDVGDGESDIPTVDFGGNIPSSQM